MASQLIPLARRTVAATYRRFSLHASRRGASPGWLSQTASLPGRVNRSLSTNTATEAPAAKVPSSSWGGTPAVTPTEDANALAKPIDFDVASKVEGQESQIVTVELEPNQILRAEAGNMVYLDQGIEMDTNTGGGMGSMFRRVITGQNMFVTDYVNRSGRNAKVALGTEVPSKILRLPLADYGGSIVAQRGAFLAGSHTIDIQTEFTKMMAGFFGGEGFILQRITGDGDALVKASGTLIRRELEEGETIRVSSGCIVAFAPTVKYDVQTMPGFKNVVFGGEGLFVTTLEGPGTVFLQGMPFDRMVDQIARRIPGGSTLIMPGMMGGGGGGAEGGADGAAEGAAGNAAGLQTSGGEAQEAAAAAEQAAQTAKDSSGALGTAGAMAAGGAGGGADASGVSPSEGLFGDAAPPPTPAADAGFSAVPSEAGAAGGGGEESVWREEGFGEESGTSADDLGGGMSGGEGGGEEGSGLWGKLWDFVMDSEQ